MPNSHVYSWVSGPLSCHRGRTWLTQVSASAFGDIYRHSSKATICQCSQDPRKPTKWAEPREDKNNGSQTSRPEEKSVEKDRNSIFVAKIENKNNLPPWVVTVRITTGSEGFELQTSEEESAPSIEPLGPLNCRSVTE